jgi:hypothetical protein
MNERIKELAIEAGYDWAWDTQIDFGHKEMEKFAELIVRECANMAESFHHHQYDFTGNLELHEFIKTHFGVN